MQPNPPADPHLHAKSHCLSEQDRADAERLMSLMQVDRYIDLPHPMLYSR